MDIARGDGVPDAIEPEPRIRSVIGLRSPPDPRVEIRRPVIARAGFEREVDLIVRSGPEVDDHGIGGQLLHPIRILVAQARHDLRTVDPRLLSQSLAEADLDPELG